MIRNPFTRRPSASAPQRPAEWVSPMTRWLVLPNRRDIVGPVCSAWGPRPTAPVCPHESCWDVMALADSPCWWMPEDWPDDEATELADDDVTFPPSELGTGLDAWEW